VTGVSPRIFEDTVNIMAGYADVDRILEECEYIGANSVCDCYLDHNRI
jgi:hypothetical protein